MVPHTPAVSPRGWANCSTLVTNEAVSDDVITRDIVMSFNTQDTQGRDVDVRNLIEEYADTYSVDPENIAWVSVYRFIKDGKQLYTTKKHTAGVLVGFMCLDIEYGYKNYITKACSKQKAIKKLQSKMHKELSLFNQWQSGEFIRVAITDDDGREVAAIENITNIMHVNDMLDQLIAFDVEQLAA